MKALKQAPYCPFKTVDSDMDRVLNRFALHMNLFYHRTQKMHMTQQDMATLAGVSVSTIRRIESGKETNLTNILKYAHACNLKLELTPADTEASLKEGFVEYRHGY